MFAILVALVFGYGLGSIPFGLVLTRAAGLGDIRAIGSGNIGATNVLRTGRKGLAAATLVGDVFKEVAVSSSSLSVDSSTALNPLASGQDFSFQSSGGSSNPRVMVIKNGKEAWIYTP